MKPGDNIPVTDDAARKMIVEEMRQVFGDMVAAFDQLSDKIAECVAIDRYLT